MTSEMRAAIPGVRSLPAGSSLAESAASQPQYMNIDSERPAASAENDVTENGFSHDALKSIDVVASPLSALTKAKPMNRTSATTWTATRTYMTSLVVVMPR